MQPVGGLAVRDRQLPAGQADGVPRMEDVNRKDDLADEDPARRVLLDAARLLAGDEDGRRRSVVGGVYAQRARPVVDGPAPDAARPGWVHAVDAVAGAIGHIENRVTAAGDEVLRRLETLDRQMTLRSGGEGADVVYFDFRRDGADEKEFLVERRQAAQRLTFVKLTDETCADEGRRCWRRFYNWAAFYLYTH